jgi:signal transduction histidine kinase
MIKTVIRNILFNAIKFTHRGGEIVIRARQEGQTVTVAIQDNGIGMNEQVLSSIFTLEKEKRHWARKAKKAPAWGWSCASSSSSSTAGKSGWKASLGKGTTVFFTLPCIRIG